MFVPPLVPLLASASPTLRPAFLIVMGGFLLLTAWRMTRGTSGWTPRILLSGAVLLAFGYSVITPLYQAGVLVPLHRIAMHGVNPDAVILWHATRTIVMNAGWLLFGTGLALHAGVFAGLKVPARTRSSQTAPLHEPVA